MPRLMLCALLAAVVAGCGGSGKPEPAPPPPTQKVIQPGAPGEPSREILATPTPQGFRAKHVDAEFMMGMIHHHQQAVVMADWVPGRTQNTSINLMAKRMAVSQQDEITLMREWLKKRGMDPDDHSHMHSSMPGMLTTQQLHALRDADGKAFDRLFLRSMTRHHQGALTMVQDLVDKGGGTEAEIEQFILHVGSDQTIEIERMQQLLTALRTRAW